MPGSPEMPYKLACLCDLRDEAGRVLLIHRRKSPNEGLCSPIGGKLDVAIGESPAACAKREIMEEAGIEVPIDRLHLGGLISEQAYEGQGHWLLFYYRVLGTVSVTRTSINEGELAWHAEDEIPTLPLPETDRRILWPLIREHEDPEGERHGFFAVHIDCSGGGLRWSIEQSEPPRSGSSRGLGTD